MDNKEFCDAIHMEIHAVRRIENYKSNPMERNISKLVIEKFSDTCKECKEIGEKIKSQPKPKSFLNKLKGALD